MVANRSTTTTHARQAPTPAPVSFTTYAYPIDRDNARVDSDTGTLHVYEFHPVFLPDERELTEAEERELAIKQAALRIAAGLELRSLRVLAREVGCTHTAMDNAVKRLCIRVGLRKFHVSDATRRKQREARLRTLNSK